MALFTLGLGMGLPLLAIAVFGAQILPRPGAWIDRVRGAFGYVMVGMAVMMLTRFLARHDRAWFSVELWILKVAIGLIASARPWQRNIGWHGRYGPRCLRRLVVHPDAGRRCIWR